MKNIHTNSRKGFTLIELLVVIGILAILLAITLIAINPAKQFSSANNTKRASNVNAILNAIGQYMADHRGQVPAGIPTGGAAAVPVGAGTACPAGVTCADLCSLLVPTYIGGLPQDPGNASAADITTCPANYNTNYTVTSNNGRVTVSAPNTDTTYGDSVFSATR